MWRSCAATAAQPTAFLLAKDIQGACTQPLRIAFTCPRKLDNQLHDCVAGIRGDGDRRGGRLGRALAAAYIGVSPSLFDMMVRDGRMPLS